MKFLRNKKVWFGIVLLIGIVLLRMAGIGQYLSLENIKIQREWLEQLVMHNYIVAACGYMFVYMVLVALSLPIGAPMSMTGGFLFGTIPGVIFAVLASTAGASLLFLVVRYLIGDYVQKTYAHRLEVFNAAVAREGWHYLLSVRFVVMIPFFVINILAALTSIPFKTFFWTTALGVAPASLVFAFAGQQLMDIDSVRDIFSLEVVGAFGLLAALAVFSLLLKRYRGTKGLPNE